MKITISGKNIDVTEGLKAAVNEKLGKLEKYFTPDTNVIVTLSVEKERQKIEVTIPVKGNIIRFFLPAYSGSFIIIVKSDTLMADISYKDKLPYHASCIWSL